MNYRVFRSSLRSVAAFVALVGLAACDDDGSGPANSLRPEDVVGVYRVCQLAFDPLGSVLPAVDIRATAFELPGGADDPVVGLDPDAQQTVELAYIPKGQVNDRELRGTYTLRGESTVELRFNTSGVNPRSLLIPDNRRMDFDFQASPLRLGMGASSQYNVSRDEYVALSGEDPANIPDAITGVLVADFRTDPCS